MYVSLLEDNGYSKQTVDTLKVADEFMKIFLPELDKILTGTYVLPEDMRVISDTENESENASDQIEKVDTQNAEDEFDLSTPAPAISETPDAAETFRDQGVKPEEKAEEKSEEGAKPAAKSDEDDPFAL